MLLLPVFQRSCSSPAFAQCHTGFFARSTQLVVVSETPWHGEARDISPTLELLDEMIVDVDSPAHGKVAKEVWGNEALFGSAGAPFCNHLCMWIKLDFFPFVYTI